MIDLGTWDCLSGFVVRFATVFLTVDGEEETRTRVKSAGELE